MRQMIRVVAWMLLFRLGTAFVRADGIALQTPPARQPTNTPQLSALLVDGWGKPISSKRSWLKQRARLKERWERFLGEVPTSRESLKTEVLATEDLGEFTRPAVPRRWLFTRFPRLGDPSEPSFAPETVEPLAAGSSHPAPDPLAGPSGASP
jgi:hypothetical protein